MKILHSKPAECTFAQLVDGLPFGKVALASKLLRYEEPVHQHKEPCPGATHKARAFRDSFVLASLGLPVEVLKRYQDIPAGFPASKLTLIELVVAAVHRLAMLIHREKTSGVFTRRRTPLFTRAVLSLCGTIIENPDITTPRLSACMTIQTQHSAPMVWRISPVTGQRTGYLAVSSSSAGEKVEQR